MNCTDLKAGDQLTVTADVTSSGASFHVGDVVTVKANGRTMNQVLAVNGRSKTMRAIPYTDLQKFFTEAK